MVNLAPLEPNIPSLVVHSIIPELVCLRPGHELIILALLLLFGAVTLIIIPVVIYPALLQEVPKHVVKVETGIKFQQCGAGSHKDNVRHGSSMSHNDQILVRKPLGLCLQRVGFALELIFRVERADFHLGVGVLLVQLFHQHVDFRNGSRFVAIHNSNPLIVLRRFSRSNSEIFPQTISEGIAHTLSLKPTAAFVVLRSEPVIGDSGLCCIAT
mmetsp:Transcript_29223/g.48283  ORF Transcript_29223/g.48283 Transcript_29223/m.48283 type:complete len:213 (+) Transcript_29223:95-733(+)